MKTLLNKNSKLHSILKKNAEVYKIKYNKDYTWALASTVNEKMEVDNS